MAVIAAQIHELELKLAKEKGRKGAPEAKLEEARLGLWKARKILERLK